MNPIQIEVKIMASAPRPAKNDSAETGVFRCTECNAMFQSVDDLHEHRISTGHVTSGVPQQNQSQQENQGDQRKGGNQPGTPNQTGQDDDSGMEDEGAENQQSR